jgi:hypothetical protein
MQKIGRAHTWGFISRSLARCLAAVLLLCIYSGALPLSRIALAKGDEVYCPLQRAWVKKDPTAQPTKQQKGLLDELCASRNEKGDFLSRLSVSLRVTRARPTAGETEKLFFAYFAAGKSPAAFRTLSPNMPAPEAVSLGGAAKGVNNAQFEFAAGSAQEPGPEDVPAFFASDRASFTSLSFFALDQISRQIKPRAPPVSI